ncbi:unnamed protein product [Cuscuta epithymum]|uniref:Glycosyltransferase n=1 Tax=Cuscuta epithymum TaxID=186058 RepID=A0AAV0EEL7_9ASTE|nr:unnamed protein product [Cuscuta epithymum]
MEGSIELVFIPAPGMGHLISAIQMAKLLLQKRGSDDLSISVLIMKPSLDSKLNSYVESLLAAHDEPSSRLKFVPLSASTAADNTNKATYYRSLIESHKQSASEAVRKIQTRMASGGTRLAGIVVDMFCTDMMDVADELGIPAYVFYTSGAAMLGLHLHLQELRDVHGKDVTEFKESDSDLEVPTYSTPFPVKFLPANTLSKTGGESDRFLDIAKRIREAKGIFVNTFLELEPHALKSLSSVEAMGRIPPVYPVGPVLNLQGEKNGESDKEIFEWLDSQKKSSVVFLCFGSGGSFTEEQVKEIAHALERSGQRFLWALVKPTPKDADLDKSKDILPKGFLERAKGIGKVITGWAPQAAILAHAAVGGFVSHCGWNSTLESVWFGVPMAAWPIYAEQQANAFQLVTDVGMAVNLKWDYKKALTSDKTPEIVKAEVIEAAIGKLMARHSEVRDKAKKLKQKSREAMLEGGSSNILQSFFHEVFNKDLNVKETSDAIGKTSELEWEEGKKLVLQLRENITTVCREVNELRVALQSEIQERRNYSSFTTIGIVLVVVAMAIRYYRVP